MKRPHPFVLLALLVATGVRGAPEPERYEGVSPPGRLDIRLEPALLQLKAEFLDENGNQWSTRDREKPTGWY